MKLTPVYVITDSFGRAELEVEGTLEQTVDAALSVYGRHTPIVYSGDIEQMKIEERHERVREEERLPNGAFDDMAMQALGSQFWHKAGIDVHTGLKTPARPRMYTKSDIDVDYPMTSEGLYAAWKALKPHFPKKGDFSRLQRNDSKDGSRKKGDVILIGDTYETPAGMSQAFLVANAKTVKAASGIDQREDADEGVSVTVHNRIAPSLSKGLAFLPHALAKREDLFPQWNGVPGLKEEVGVCVGSSDTCRKSCLVYAGQNQAVEHNNLIKGDRLLGLLREPKAFIRMMVDSMIRHVKACKQAGMVPYFRPNILSDIPWEVLYPELWDYPEFKNMSVYDYTKVGGRNTSILGKLSSERGADPMLNGKSRYDLTFSFSGGNAHLMQKELDRGMRLAIVFLRQLKSGSLKPSATTGKVNYKAAESFDNMRFMGQRIIDGDEHDLRPLDPQGTVVGLRFKSLRGKESGSRSQQIATAGDFVVGGMEALTVNVGGPRANKPGYGLPRYAENKRVEIYAPEGAHNLKWKVTGKDRENNPANNVKYLVEAFDDGHGNIICAGTPQQQGVSLASLFDIG
jgi:hypothetical protein